MTTPAAISGNVFGGVIVGGIDITIPKQPYPLFLTSLATIVDTTGCAQDVMAEITWRDGEGEVYAMAIANLIAGNVCFLAFGLNLNPNSINYVAGLLAVTAPLPRDVLVEGVEAVRFRLLGDEASNALVSNLRYRFRVSLTD